MFSFWQNLTAEDRQSRGQPSHTLTMPWHSRGSLHPERSLFPRLGYELALELGWQWGARFTLDQGEPALCWSFHTLFGSLYLSVEDHRIYKLAKWLGISDYASREIGLHQYVVDEEVVTRWLLWSDPDSWSPSTPRWRDGSFNLFETLLGSWEHSAEETHAEQRTITIPGMGEAPSQECTVEITVERWEQHRARAPWLTRGGFRGNLDVVEGDGYTHPGKGTAIWNQGSDAITAVATPVSGPHASEEVLAYFIESGEHNRRRFPL